MTDNISTDLLTSTVWSRNRLKTGSRSFLTLQKHAYSDILKILPTKNENFQIKKKSDIFHISAQNIDYGYSLEPPHRGGSNEYPQSMYLSRNKKNNAYPCKPQFYYIKVGFKGINIIYAWFRDEYQVFNLKQENIAGGHTEEWPNFKFCITKTCL